MPLVRSSARRHGALAVEFAIVSNLAFFLFLAMIIGGLGVFRYQEVAHLAREGARYASTHGGRYAQDGIPQQTGVPAVSSSKGVQDYLRPRGVLLEPSSLMVTASWSAGSNVPSYANADPTLVPPGQKTIRNYVSVTVAYQWLPELFLVGPIELKSTSTMPMSY